MMISFTLKPTGQKRKQTPIPNPLFQDEETNNSVTVVHQPKKKQKGDFLPLRNDDRKAQSELFEKEACQLAEAGRYLQALQKINEGISLHPHCARLHEEKAQILLAQEEFFHCHSIG